jgi:hypothetical protein
MLHISTFILLFHWFWQIHRYYLSLNISIKLLDIDGFFGQLFLALINVSTIILANCSFIAITPAFWLSQRSAIILNRLNMTGVRYIHIITSLSQRHRRILSRRIKLAWIWDSYSCRGISMDYLFSVL